MLKHTITWREIDGWFDFQDIYLQAIAEAKDYDRFVEVGSYHGKSTAFMAWNIKKSGKRISLDVVDIWFGKHRQQCEYNLRRAGLLDRVNLVQTESSKVSRCYRDHSLQFVFIDADHQYESVLRDMKSWYPKLKDGCLLGGHDYSDDWPGVKQAVGEFSGGKFERRGNSWLMRKDGSVV